MQAVTFETITDVQAYVAGIAGPCADGTAARIATIIRDEAHERGMRYGDDWKDVIADLTEPEDRWLALLASEDGVVTCLYCGADVTERDNVPSGQDAEAWTVLAVEHAPDCEWIATRVHRRDAPGLVAATPDEARAMLR